ncbi:MAG: Hint domain-containing protein [Pseudomonadota bacterium]
MSGGEQLSGITQGDGSHLDGLTITLDDNLWEGIEVRDTDPNFADSDNSQRLDGTQVFDGVSYADNRRVEAEYELLLEDPDGNTYTVVGFNINEPGVTSFATVEGLAFIGGVGGFPPSGVPLTVLSSAEGPSFPFTSLASPPCFTDQTWVATPEGERPMAELGPGDLVNTLDHGPKPVLWIGRACIPASVIEQDTRFRPVLIKRDAFGQGVPCRDTRLSPQHRVIVEGWRGELYFGEDQVLVPICKLINDNTIRPDHAGNGVTYMHVLFDGHEIIRADNLPSESFLPDALTQNETSHEILRIFPDMHGQILSPRPVRPCVRGRTAHLLNLP